MEKKDRIKVLIIAVITNLLYIISLVINSVTNIVTLSHQQFVGNNDQGYLLSVIITNILVILFILLITVIFAAIKKANGFLVALPLIGLALCNLSSQIAHTIIYMDVIVKPDGVIISTVIFVVLNLFVFTIPTIFIGLFYAKRHVALKVLAIIFTALLFAIGAASMISILVQNLSDTHIADSTAFKNAANLIPHLLVCLLIIFQLATSKAKKKEPAFAANGYPAPMPYAPNQTPQPQYQPDYPPQPQYQQEYPQQLTPQHIPSENYYPQAGYESYRKEG